VGGGGGPGARPGRPRPRPPPPPAGPAAARQELHLADPARAAALLHTARRLHDEPAADYRLQSQLHRLREDGEGARANGLLAREHAGLSTDAPTFLAELWLLAEPPSPAFARPTAPVPAAPVR
jgi:hypothetical protein